MDKQDATPNFQAFSDNLRALIETHHMTAKDLAREAEIPDATIYRYLHSERVPKIDNIITLSKYFDVSIDWLLGLTDDQHGRWTPAALEIAHRYMAASPDDRRVVETALEKYKGV